MKVLTTEQIRQADEYTIRNEPVRSVDLMERASQGIAAFILRTAGTFRKIRIFAGSGNNGGDGIAVARLLAVKGLNVDLFLAETGSSLSADARYQLERLPDRGNLSVARLTSVSELPEIHRNDLVVDALFGSGLNREPSGLMAAVIEHLNASPAKILAIDIPSGLFGEDNRLNSCWHVIRAWKTLTFEFPKLCFLLGQYHQFVGDWEIVPINLHTGYLTTVETPWNLTTPADAAGWLVARPKFSHKGTYGHALLVAGSAGKAGAAVLAARACIRSGAGLTTVSLPAECNGIVQTAVPEAMTVAGGEKDHLTELPPLKPYSAIGIGPGIGMHPETLAAFEKLLDEVSVPLVLDADALNLLAANPGLLLKVPENTVLTPHPGEYKRLFGEDPDDYSRLLRLRELSQYYRLVIVLKGAVTTIAEPGGSVWFNTSGNPGMATGGSGDALTGLITGLAAQGRDPFTAARLGVLIHGLAGDLASGTHGQEALVAGDIIENLGKAFLQIHQYSK